METRSDFRAYGEWRWSLEPGQDLVDDFLLPALVRARRYDRQAGFFSSSSLLVSARGIEHLLRTVPRTEWPAYRLIVCEQLSEEDVAAIAAGERLRGLEECLTPRMLRALEEPADAAARDRLGLLAALFAVGFAAVRVVVPCDAERRPKAGAIEHAKAAILYDRAGNILVAFGSANESWQGWVGNNEQMDLYASWEEPAWSRYGRAKVERFERLWAGRDPHALTVELPRAVRERLVSLAPDPLPPLLQPPTPLEGMELWTTEQEAVIRQFLRDAPRLAGGQDLGLTSAAVAPWPHHVSIVRTATRSVAPRFLFCDEVGLGKTAEAAFVIRQLRLQGRARRVLILAPKNLCDQWQDELWTKFALPAEQYDGTAVIPPDLGDASRREPVAVERRAVFEGADRLLIVGTELARRLDRRRDLLAAPPWDLVVVDEAHHARREGYDRPDREPNRLLGLLRDLGERTRGLLLLTATPMQIDPREVWDLLRVLGLTGAFGRSFEAFEAYYTCLAEIETRPPTRSDLDALFGVIATGVEADAELLAVIERQDPTLYRQCERAVSTALMRDRLVNTASRGRALVREFLLAYAPTRQRLFRTTRQQLREAGDRYPLGISVPRRVVEPQHIPFDTDERRVYQRVDEYLARHYQNAQRGGQQGLGFVLTCYRRRMSSSPFALQKSLERLQARLRSGRTAVAELVEDDDWEAAGALNPEEAEQDTTLVVAPQALADLEDLLADVRGLTRDTKLMRLYELLGDLALQYNRVIIFTQYTDTMDYLRERLLDREVRIGCYSGRGGEIYDVGSRRFVRVSKATLQDEFRRDNGIRYLVCTEAAAEGLNLQICGALINYDMPWNPMRVEQRIGRIDRIGQEHPIVRVYNLFSTPSVEDQVYAALADRIDLFQRFIGPLQPILVSIQHTIQSLAMTIPDQRQVATERAMAELQRQLADLEQVAPRLPVAEGFARPVTPTTVPTGPVGVDDLRRACLASPTLLDRGALRDLGDGIYELRWNGRLYRITFDRDLAERRYQGAAFFTYGHPVFDAWIRLDGSAPALTVFGLSRDVNGDEITYRAGSRRVNTLGELLGWLRSSNG